jgi:hypothetical protein
LKEREKMIDLPTLDDFPRSRIEEERTRGVWQRKIMKRRRRTGVKNIS